MDLKNKKVHMVGIGGIGMSGLALLLTGLGARVSGSDLCNNTLIRKLRGKGVRINIGHDKNNVKTADIVVHSSSIRDNNPEILNARQRDIKVISRIELLGMIACRHKHFVAVTGTHGKTTITGMASFLMQEAGFEPTVLIGGESPHFNGNAKLGSGDLFVAEVDESDGRFVGLKPDHIIISNLEKEHVEHYRSKTSLFSAFRKFLVCQDPGATLFYRLEDPALLQLTNTFRGNPLSFGFSREADIYADKLEIRKLGVRFDCFRGKTRIGRFVISIPGKHNVLNTLPVISLGLRFGIRAKLLKDIISEYRNVKRRFETVGIAKGIRIVEDYAHHPTEIKATISAAHALKPRNIITVFQPHRYSRTKAFYKDFSESFTGSSEVILTEVYSASEERRDGADSERIYNRMRKNPAVPVKLMDKDEVAVYVSERAKKGDLVLVLGAGDIGKTSREIFDTIIR